jgi:hypothetical protein
MWARDHEYAAYIRRSNSTPSGQPEAIYMVCELGGLGTAYIPNGKSYRRTATSKVNCQFSVRISYHKRDGLWHLVVRNPTHNHEPTASSCPVSSQ